MKYALYGEEPTDLNGEQMRTFILIRPSWMPMNGNDKKSTRRRQSKRITTMSSTNFSQKLKTKKMAIYQ